MSGSPQTINSAVGLDKDRLLSMARTEAASALAAVAELDPTFPFYVISFDASFFGFPAPILPTS